MQRINHYRTDVVAFIDDLVKFNELGQPFRLSDHQREILRLAFQFDAAGCLLWGIILWACPKKSGKTFIQALVDLWWAFTQEAPNEIYNAANDLEQVQGRVFKTMIGILRHNPALGKSAEIQSRQIILTNGTTITALSTDYSGAAGSNHGLTSWDELWAYTSESSQRLWDELTPVPTRKNSIRFITTYAGWQNESALLWNLYKQGVGKEEHPEGQGERIHPTLPVYANREARLFVYWDHEPRMAWQTEDYYKAQRLSLRAGTYLRHHENRWVSAESTFILPELWDPCVDPQSRPLLPGNTDFLFVGVDAATKHDTAAVVAVTWEGKDKLAVAVHRIWKPTPAQPLDLEATLEAYLEYLQGNYHVVQVLADPWQLHRTITTLQARGLKIREFPQTVGNTTLMGQTLFDLLNGRNLKLYRSDELRAQALSTVAIESIRGWRIAKEKTTRKIDAIVAMAMACVAALEGKPHQFNPNAFPTVVEREEQDEPRTFSLGPPLGKTLRRWGLR